MVYLIYDGRGEVLLYNRGSSDCYITLFWVEDDYDILRHIGATISTDECTL